ncbi:MAG: hypothetical protein HYU88_09925 [Chloroflexi bacterium]|nr:hypothetical protein [Chloroflexota bacterium]MBI4505771.1 hypothetical protein [Chloroflexota bacterium]
MPSNTKKVTFSLSEDVLAGVARAVARGAAPSKNALVERAVVRELKELRRQARQTAWEEAARDPLLLHDIAEVEAGFDDADAETAQGSD